MKLRLTAIIMALIMTVLSCGVITYANDEVISYSNEINELKVIGIIDDINVEEDKLITRAEFASLIARVKGYTEEALSSDMILFNDVPIKHEAFNSINFCARSKYMSGYTGGYFMPDNIITTEEAIKVIISMLGYDYLANVSGGYPTGYVTEAYKLNLLKGIDATIGENLLYVKALKLIHNSLSIPVAKIDGVTQDGYIYEIDSKENILSSVYDMYRDSGIVTATDVAGVLSYSAANENSVIINGITLYTTDSAVRNLLGYNVDFIYKYNEVLDRRELILALPNSKNNIIKIDEKNYISFIGGIVRYLENDKDTTVNISPYFDFIYNGQKRIFDNTLIENSIYGEMTLISSGNNSTYDIMLFNDYKTITAQRFNDENKTVYDKHNIGDSVVLNEKNLKVTITDINGKTLDFSEIRENDVLTYYGVSGVYVNAVVTSNTIEGNITAKHQDNGIDIEDTYYEFSMDNLNASYPLGYVYTNIDLYSLSAINSKVKVYLDKNNKIAFFEIVKREDDKKIGYIIRVSDKKHEMDEDILCKLYVANEGIKTLKIASTVNVNETSYKNPTHTSMKALLPQENIVLFKQNEDEEIKYVVTAKAPNAYSDHEDGFTKVIDNETLYYYNNTKTFLYKTYVDASTIAIVIPDNINSVDDSSFGIVNLDTYNGNKTISAYTYSKNDKYADIITVKQSNFHNIQFYDSRANLITRKVDAVDENENKVTKVYYKNSAGEDYFYIGDNVADLADASHYASSLNVGDVIMIAKDNNNILHQFQGLYKHSSTSPVFTGYNFASNRLHSENIVVKGKFKNMDNEFLTVDIEGDQKRYMKYDADTKVIIVTKNGTTLNITDGEMADIQVDEDIYIQALRYRTDLVIVYR